MGETLPRHVAIIMDGNGRWAKKQHLPRTAGHLLGTKNVRNITIAANSLGIQTLTLYAFSCENWKRPAAEVEYLMRLPAQFFASYIDELHENNVKLGMLGDASALPAYTRQPVLDAIERTKHNTGMQLVLALNYGGRQEMADVMKRIVQDGIPAAQIDEQLISSYMRMPALNDIDLVIRTSGEQRLSNFLLWQSVYSELIFTDTLWPDFDEAALRLAFDQYAKRKRRYGGLTDEA